MAAARTEPAGDGPRTARVACRHAVHRCAPVDPRLVRVRRSPRCSSCECGTHRGYGRRPRIPGVETLRQTKLLLSLESVYATKAARRAGAQRKGNLVGAHLWREMDNNLL